MLTFSNITSFLKRNKKILYYTGFFVVLFMIGSGDVFAADPTAAELETKKVQGWISFLNSLMVGLASMMALMTYLVTMFLDPAWLNGSLFELNKYFKEIWILVSNVVYFIFAFILIWIAFMNIIGKGDKWELKSALPKFIIGVLIVPFSWFFIQFILSLSAILTASVLTLPADSFSSYKTDLTKITVPKRCILNYGSQKASKSGTSTGIIDCEGYVFGEKGDNSQTLAEAFKSKNIEGAIFGSLAVYTYGVVSFDKLGKITSSDVNKSIKTIGDFIFKVVFDILFVLVFAILIITLGLVLVVRGIYIWIYTMMSPIFGLMYFFDKKEGGGDGFFGKFNLKEFIALAMVPVYVMAALSFGFLFINVVSKGIQSHTSSGVEGPITIKGDTISISNFKLTINGSLSSTKTKSGGNGPSLLGSVSQSAGTVMGLIGGLIMQLFAIVVLRGAVMAALRSSEITKTLTQPIYDFGNQVGGLVAKSPMYAPVFGGQSMTSMQSIGSQVAGNFQAKQTTKASTFLSDHGFGDKTGSIANLNKLQAKIKGISGNNKEGNVKNIIPLVQQVIKESGSFELLKNTPAARDAMFEAMKDMDITVTGVEKANDLISQPLMLKLLEKMDKKAENLGSNLFVDKIQGALISKESVDTFAKSGEVTPVPTGGDNSGIKLDISGTRTVINVNGGSDRQVGYDDKTRKITDIKGAESDIAEYIIKNNLNSTSIGEIDKELPGFNKLHSELNKYFKKDKDGKIIFDGSGNGNSTLMEYLHQNNPKSTN